MSSAGYTQLPPLYQTFCDEIHEEPAPRQNPGGPSDGVPDDFKYGVSISQSDISIRHAFIRKVYGIITVQLFATTAVGAYLRHVDATSGFLTKYTWTVYAAFVGAIISLVNVWWKHHSYPSNIILLSAFTFCEAYVVGAETALYSSSLVLQAIAITLGLFVALTLFTVQSRYGFLNLGSALFFSLWAVTMVGLVHIFVPFSKTTDIVVAVFIALIFSGIVIKDTHRIMNRLSPDETGFGISLDASARKLEILCRHMKGLTGTL
ncbi:UPF0005-domain-containing protein [Martensiomyces pterosporus]|nr:UPF0005-domain-containing protein [Martensiomyces pterosporus]